jgi:carbon-monoxide dehydrogenase large subunit
MVQMPGATRRLSGDRFVSGRVRYLADEPLPRGCLHLAFVRSPHAHAQIAAVDTAPALAHPDIRAVLTGAEARGAIGDLVCLVPAALTGVDGPLTLPCLPVERVRYAGEPVALVVADSPDAARRAAALVDVRYEVLTPLLEIDEALAEGAPPQHPQLPSNVLMAGGLTGGDGAAALDGCARVVEGAVAMGRGSAVPLETRGCVAEPDASTGRLSVRAATQQPHALRADLARQLRLAESDIHVVAPPLGGAFGFKFPGLPEEPLVCLMAMRLGRPVSWLETREEAMLAGAREYRARYRIGFDDDGRVGAIAVEFDANVGALCATPGPIMPAVAGSTFPGGYDIPDFEVGWRAVLTNKGPWNGARGFGKELTSMVLECAMDDVARSIGTDPAEVRRLNLLPPDRLPHRTPSMTLDSGDYPRALEMVLELAEYRQLRTAQRERDPRSRVRRGVGVAFELTPEGIDYAGSLARGYESATVRMDTTGTVTVLTGVTSPGTGSETAIAQLVAEQLGVGVRDVRVVQGDTDRAPYGAGSFSSRAVMVGGTAAHLAAGELRAQLASAAGALLGAASAEIEAADGFYRVVGSPQRCIPVAALAATIMTVGAALPGVGQPRLEATRTYGPDNLQSIPDQNGRLQQYPTYAYAVHVAAVDIDLDTGTVALHRLASVHDCGTVINQELVNAQLNGAVTMGVGIALHEEECYTPDGRPLSTNFKRYLLPRIKDIPELRFGHLTSPSPFTLLGTKGAGEAGVGGAAAAIAGAVRDAVGDRSGSPVRTPLTPPRVLALLDAAAALPASTATTATVLS